MAVSREKLRLRAAKAGVRASKKRGRPISRPELLRLRIQTMPAASRILLGTAGAALIAAAWLQWPSGSNSICGVEAIVGIILALMGIFGVRRTIGRLADRCVLDGVGGILDLIGEAISNIDI